MRLHLKLERAADVTQHEWFKAMPEKRQQEYLDAHNRDPQNLKSHFDKWAVHGKMIDHHTTQALNASKAAASLKDKSKIKDAKAAVKTHTNLAKEHTKLGVEEFNQTGHLGHANVLMGKRSGSYAGPLPKNHLEKLAKAKPKKDSGERVYGTDNNDEPS